MTWRLNEDCFHRICPVFRKSFKPNVFVDIAQYLNEKVEAMKIYESEIGHFPFPRSENAVRALAQFRGCNSGFEYAEGFELLREIS